MANTQISNKKLKAIVFTDIVNFTQLSAKDEQHALELIDKQREIIKPIVEEYSGEWLKEIGDGLLLSFDSSLDAVNCSIKIQKSLQDIDNLKIRIGIHQGDVFIKDGDVFGDDVNITSRVESFSPEGGIAISDKICKDVSGVENIKTLFIGFKKLKGVTQETKIYCITSNNLPAFRKQWLPYLSGILLMFLGGGAAIFSVIGMLLTKLSIINFFPDVSWDLFFKSMIRHIAFFIFGYSNLMYVNGVSSKAHKYFVYGSYIVIITMLFALMTK